MTPKQVIEFLHWLREQQKQCLDDAVDYNKRRDLKMWAVKQSEATAYGKVIDKLTKVV